MVGLKSASLARDFGTLFRAGTLAGVGDGRLLDRYVNDHDEAAFEELLARHGPMVLGICRRWLDDPRDIEDAFQATFLLLIRKAGSLQDRHALSSWLYGVALRVARRARANSIRRRFRERPMIEEPTRPAPAPREMTGDEVLSIVDEEIRRLPDQQQIAVILCLLEGQTHEAAARQLGWRLGTVKSRISAARKTLTRRLTRRGLTPSGVATILPTGLNRVGFRSPLSPELVRATLEAARETISKTWISAIGAGAVSELVREVARIMIVARIRAAAMVALAMMPLVWAAPGFLSERPVEQVPQAEEKAPAAAPVVAAVKPKVDRYGDPLPAGAAMRLGTIRHRQLPSVGSITYTPDGKTFITDAQGRLHFWNSIYGRKLREIDTELSTINDLAVSPDGKTIAVVGSKFEPERNLYVHRIKFFDMASGLFVRVGEWTERGDIIKIGYSPDGKAVAVVSDNGTMRLWDAATAVLLKAESVGVSRVMKIAFSRDPANPVMAIGSDHEISVSTIAEPQKSRTIATQKRFFGSTNVAISPDGTILAGTLPDRVNGEIQLWRTGDGTPLRRLKLQNNQTPYEMTFSPDGKILALNGNMSRLEAFDVATGESMDLDWSFDPASGPMTFAPDGKTLATAGERQTLHLWDLKTRQDRLATHDAHRGGVGILAFLSDGKTLISGSEDHTVRIWDLEKGAMTKTLPHDGWVRFLSVSDDASILASASTYPGAIHVWKLKTSEPFSRWGFALFEQESSAIHGVKLDAQGSSVIGVLDDGSIKSWDLETRKERLIAKPKLEWNAPDEGPVDQMDALNYAIFSKDGRTAAMINNAQRMLFVDVTTGEVRFKDRAYLACAIAPDGRSLAVGKRGRPKQIPLADGRMRIDSSKATGMIAWLDSQTGRALREIEIPESTVTTLAFSSDGKSIAAGISPNGKNGIVRVYRLRDMRVLHEFEVPCHSVRSLAFTPDGKRLAAGLEDTSILIWDLKESD